MALNLDHLELFKELSNRAKTSCVAEHLKAKIVTSMNQINTSLEEIRVYFRHFTDHSITHSTRIISNIGNFLTKSQYKQEDRNNEVISDADLYMLIAVALVHDIGMVISETDINNLSKEKAFLEFCKAQFPTVYESMDYTSLSYGIDRILISEYFRRNHTKRSLELILRDDILPKSLTEDCDRLKYWIGTISEAHGLPFETICNLEKYPTSVDIQLPGGMNSKFNPRFVAICLRLGDLLDINTARACPILRIMAEPLPLISTAHWDQYKSIEILNLAPNSEITISGTCPNQNAERILREWVSWIEEESALAIATQNTDKDFYNLKLGRIKYSVKPESKNGKNLYEFLEFKFNLDEKIVFERLFGKVLYGREEIALREIIQNSIDAHRAHIASICHDEISNWTILEKEKKIKIYHKKLIEQSKKLPIRIILREEVDENNQTNFWIDFIDLGIGMSRETIEKYLLKVGRTRWGNDPLISELGIGGIGIGKFGVGFISLLMISDRIIIISKSRLPNQEGIKATIYGWNKYLATESFENNSYGTTISVKLNKKWFKDDIDLCRIICELVPSPDFPIVFETKRNKTKLPCIINESKDNNIGIFNYNSDGSKIILHLKTKENSQNIWLGKKEIIDSILNFNKQITLIQDGILVSEVSKPQNNEIESFLLRQYNILIDLRGESRIALDLSRNTIEEGQQLFWDKMVPEIWKNIGIYFGKNNFATYIISRLVDERYKLNIDSPMLLIQENVNLFKGYESLLNIETLTFSEALGSPKCRINKDYPSLILPYVEINELVVAMERKFNSIEYEDEDDENENDKEMINLNYFKKKKPIYYYNFDEEYNYYSLIWFKLKKRNTTLDREWKKIFDNYKYIKKLEQGNILFSKNNSADFSDINDFIGFQVSKHRLHLIEPYKSRPVLIPIDSSFEDLKVSSKKIGLTLSDFYLFIIYNIFSIKDKTPSELKGKFAKNFYKFNAEIGNRFLKQIELNKKKSKNHERQPDSNNILNSNLHTYGHLFKGIAKTVGLEKATCSWENLNNLAFY